MALNGLEVMVIEWAMVVLTFTLVCFRIKLRMQRRGRPTVSDAFVFAGWLFFLAQCCMDTVFYHIGYLDRWIYEYLPYTPETGLETYELSVFALKVQFTENITYFSAMYCMKFAMIIFYYELFPKCLTKLRWALHVTAVLAGCGWVYMILANLLGCKRIQDQWAIGPQHCWPSFVLLGLQMIFHIGSDLLIYILPLFVLRKLALTRAQKIGVGLTFSLGFLCIGFTLLLQISYVVVVPTSHTTLYGTLEQTWAIVVVCCPAFKSIVTGKLYKRVRRFIFGDYSTTGTSSSSEGGDGSGRKGKGLYKLARGRRPRGEEGSMELSDTDSNVTRTGTTASTSTSGNRSVTSSAFMSEETITTETESKENFSRVLFRVEEEGEEHDRTTDDDEIALTRGSINHRGSIVIEKGDNAV